MLTNKLLQIGFATLAVAAITFSLAASAQAQTETVLYNFGPGWAGNYADGTALLDERQETSYGTDAIWSQLLWGSLRDVPGFWWRLDLQGSARVQQQQLRIVCLADADPRLRGQSVRSDDQRRQHECELQRHGMRCCV